MKISKNIKRIGLFGGVIIGGVTITAGFLGAYGGIFNFSKKENKVISASGETKTAYFAGGCFWCMEGIFEYQDGVEGAYSGYTGGKASTATYQQTSTKTTQHREAVRVVYDPAIISYQKILELYWTQIDPTDDTGQFNDRGFVYSPAIYYTNEEEKNIAERSKQALQDSGRFKDDIVVVIEPAKEFFDAEQYHQDYYKKNPIRYKVYTSGSGRRPFIEENWQDRIDELEGKYFVNRELVEVTSIEKYSEEALRERLTPLQYKVTQEEGTEKPFDNQYWDNKQAGIYVDIIDGTPLYSSLDKYVSGTGWPSFTQPISLDFISQHEDNGLFYTRTEIKSASSNAHLGHVFTDGPADAGGLRYCMNSAAMRFIPVSELEEEGYGAYVEMFK